MAICIEITCCECGKTERVEFGDDEDAPTTCPKCSSGTPDIILRTEPFDPAAPTSMEHFEGFGYT